MRSAVGRGGGCRSLALTGGAAHASAGRRDARHVVFAVHAARAPNALVGRPLTDGLPRWGSEAVDLPFSPGTRRTISSDRGRTAARGCTARTAPAHRQLPLSSRAG